MSQILVNIGMEVRSKTRARLRKMKYILIMFFLSLLTSCEKTPNFKGLEAENDSDHRFDGLFVTGMVSLKSIEYLDRKDFKRAKEQQKVIIRGSLITMMEEGVPIPSDRIDDLRRMLQVVSDLSEEENSGMQEVNRKISVWLEKQ